MYRRSTRTRRGSIIPLMAITIVALLGFVALSIDVGLMAMARTQAQNAADCAALTGARTLTGDRKTDNNFAACEPAARHAASVNQVMGKPVDASNPAVMTVRIGAYAYDPVAGQFNIKLPKGPNDPYCLVRVHLAINDNPTYFGRVFNVNSFHTAAMATAAHRPRDVALILDFSGSMRFSSLLGVPYNGTRDNGTGTGSGSNNPEPVFPKFGHYASASAGLRNTADLTLGGKTFTPANVTVADAANDTRPPVVADFYQHPPYTDPDIPAFHNTITGTGPTIPDDASLGADNLAGGDRPLRVGNSSSTSAAYARRLSNSTDGIVTDGSAAKIAGFNAEGYKFFTGVDFQGYTRGPRYWGKTFFMWPPDPSAEANGTTRDWRRKFFTATTGSIDNTKLWDAAGNWRSPDDGGWRPNYAAILAWIKSTGPNPFPHRLHSGHISYYTSIPNTINTSTFPPADPNQRFWKEYIDHCLGVQQTSSTNWSVVNERIGYGADFAWGTANNTDNPRRPRTHFWFGPMTMLDFIGNYNMNRMWWPGTCHEAPLYACKLAVRGALLDCENNHPNDYMSLILFSVPRNSASDTSDRFNTPRVPLGKNYLLMQNSLWYPQATLNADGTNTGTDVTPYDAANVDTPRAFGGTCYSMGLMLAYNQFQFTTPADTTLRRWVPPSGSIPEGLAGGMGRKGAQKMIIFMTDGAPNTRATATLRTGSPKFYPIRYNPANPGGSEYPATSGTPDNDPAVRSEIYGIIDQLRADHTSGRRPFRLHTIGFGPVFDSTNPELDTCLATLQTMQYRGNTQSHPATPLDSFKVVTGTDAEVINKLQFAITTIMQGSIQIVLLE